MGNSRSKNQNGGMTGQPGQPGQHGVPGAPGCQGPAGPPGLNGCNGTKGEPEYRGDAGTFGGEGERGESGQPGERGDPATSAEGLKGINGLPGRNGSDGLPGQPGPKGAQGDRDLVGPEDTKGKKSFEGPEGPKDEPTRSVTTSKGQQSLKGQMGPPGAPEKIETTGLNKTEAGGKGDKRPMGDQEDSGIVDAKGYHGDQKALLQPEHSKKILSMDEFWANVQLAQHYAVKRNTLGITYFHHFVIYEVSRFPEFVKVIHYTGTAGRFLRSSSLIVGTVTEEVFERNGIGSNSLLDVEIGLYLVDDPSYCDCFDPEKAIERARQRVGECEYDPLFNNCEHFARWTLTGVPSSHQTDRAPAWLKLAGAYLGELKALINRITSSAARAVNQSLLAGLEKLICRSSCAPRLLQHTAGATRGAMAAIASSTFAISLLCETLSFTWIALKKYRLHKEGKMNEQDFKTAVSKELFASVLSVIGSTICAVVGQILIPVPLLGGIIGCFAGDLVARSCAPALYMFIESASLRFGKWFSALSDKIGSMVTRRWFTKTT